MSISLTQTTRWNVKPRNYEIEEMFVKALNISPLTASILIGRNIHNLQDAERFLYPSLNQMYNPQLLPDYEIAVKLILEAKNNQQHIFIHGDYDVDGVTSTALLTRFLRSIGCKVTPHVPHRIKEGYGIHLDAVKLAYEIGTKLFITCDCGIMAFEQVKAAKELGMNVIVTDHHELGNEMPQADAVVNLHRNDSKYPFKELSGAGVVFKLCEGLTNELNIPVQKYYRAFLDLVTLGTVSDMVPLYDENRIIVRYGLEQIQNTQKEGLKALLEVSNGSHFNDPLKAWHIGYRLGPRLNAVGRIEESALALALLLENCPHKSREFALKLDDANQRRRFEQQKSYEEAYNLVIQQGLHEKPILIVASENWHPGIIGLVASKLTETFYRPSFVISIDHEKKVGKGSARSIPGYDLAEALMTYQDLFIANGGHKRAAGFSIHLENIPIMQSSFYSHAQTILSVENFIPTLNIDADLNMKEADFKATEELNLLEPFGEINPEPYFLTRDLEFISIEPTASGEHSRIILRDASGETRKAMVFGIGNQLTSRHIGQKADIVYTTSINHFNGKSSLQWIIKDYMLK